MSLVIQQPAPTHIAVEGGGSFPVRRVHCVGRNYAEHTREMGGDPAVESPIFFSKPTDAVFNGVEMPYPPMTEDLHHEVELVLALKSGGQDIDETDALAHVYGAAVGIDFTRRDRQAEAKKSGKPWEIAKAFDASGPVGLIRPGLPPEQGEIGLSVEGQSKQSGELADMIWSCSLIIAHLSRLVRLEAGDLIFTGTPAGVGPVYPGETVRAYAADLAPLEMIITSPS